MNCCITTFASYAALREKKNTAVQRAQERGLTPASLKAHRTRSRHKDTGVKYPVERKGRRVADPIEVAEKNNDSRAGKIEKPECILKSTIWLAGERMSTRTRHEVEYRGVGEGGATSPTGCTRVRFVRVAGK